MNTLKKLLKKSFIIIKCSDCEVDFFSTLRKFSYYVTTNSEIKLQLYFYFFLVDSNIATSMLIKTILFCDVSVLIAVIMQQQLFF